MFCKNSVLQFTKQVVTKNFQANTKLLLFLFLRERRVSKDLARDKLAWTSIFWKSSNTCQHVKGRKTVYDDVDDDDNDDEEKFF